MTAVLRGYYGLFSSRPVPSPIHNLWKNLRMIPALLDFRLISHLTPPGGVTCSLFLFQLFEPVQDYLGPGSAGTWLNTSSEFWLRTYHTTWSTRLSVNWYFISPTTLWNRHLNIPILQMKKLTQRDNLLQCMQLKRTEPTSKPRSHWPQSPWPWTKRLYCSLKLCCF